MPILIVFLVVLLLDQVSKWYVRASFQLGESLPVIGAFFKLTYIENTGAAFGIFAGNALLLVVAACVVVGALLFFYKSQVVKTCWLDVAMGLVLAGAVGNVIDRIWKASVTDMFDFGFFPIFNVADIAVCVGVFLLIVHMFKTPDP